MESGHLLFQRLASGGAPGAAPQAYALPTDEVRFAMAFSRVVETAGVTAKLRLLAQSQAMHVEPLFPDDDATTSLLLLRFADGGARKMRRAELHAIAYWLKDEFGLLTCEPDLPSDYFADPVAPQPGEKMATRSAGFCWKDTPHSDDETWSNRVTRVPQAWKIAPGRGRGVLIGHPDTGVAGHHEIDASALRLDLARDTLSGDDDATDPLDPATANPGHGTSTASVIVSGENGRIVGSAPGASLVPIRCIDDVVVIFGTAVARAIHHARKTGCHVVSMSLGGAPSHAVETAIGAAIRANLLVLAAAGNCWPHVVYPARYAQVVAVAGTDLENRPWAGGSKGATVDFAAPADNVWRAGFDLNSGKKQTVGYGKGTSYAVAISAGIAALWLSHHGRDRLIAEADRRKISLQALFAAAVAQTAHAPKGWDRQAMGAGVIDAERLLLLPIRDIGARANARFDPPGQTDDILSLVEEVSGIAPGREALDWRAYRHELAWLLFERMKAKAGRRADLAEGEAISQRLRFAIGQSGDGALARLVRKPGAEKESPTNRG